MSFAELGQTNYFELGQSFRIEFTGITEEVVHYRRVGKRFEPAYHFRVDELSAKSR